MKLLSSKIPENAEPGYPAGLPPVSSMILSVPTPQTIETPRLRGYAVNASIAAPTYGVGSLRCMV